MQASESILLVEDDRMDQKAVKRSLKELNMTNPLFVVENGQEALDYLNDSENPVPCLILLDLNLPKMNGLEFLKKTKGDYKLKQIPVVVLTTSQEESDLTESYQLGIAGYITKPVEYKQFVEAMRIVKAYWYLNRTPIVKK